MNYERERRLNELDGHEAHDFVAQHLARLSGEEEYELRHDDYFMEMPQPGGRIKGREAVRAFQEAYTEHAPPLIVRLWRVLVGDKLWVAEAVSWSTSSSCAMAGSSWRRAITPIQSRRPPGEQVGLSGSTTKPVDAIRNCCARGAVEDNNQGRVQPMIVERRCPRCAICRTMRLGQWGSFCHNCRLQWDRSVTAAEAVASASQVTPVDAAAYSFRPVELMRLTHYRAAIRHGLYTDWPAVAEKQTLGSRAIA